MSAFSWKSFKAIMIIPGVVSIILIGLLLIPPSAKQTPVWASSAHLFHPGFGEATIDGNIDSSEWATADSYSLLMYNSVSSIHTGTLYVMQSETDLYLGFTVDDDEFSTGYTYGLYGDTLLFQFDDNNSGALYEISENKISLAATTPWYLDAYFTNTSGSSDDDINQPGGEANGEGMSGRHGSLNHYEVRFPLCSGDAYDFCLFSGNILGLQVKYFDVEVTLDYAAHFYPGINLDDLVTIVIIGEKNINYFPLIMK